MKKGAALVLVGFAVFAAAAVASTTRAPSVAVPRAAKAPSKELGPLLAVVPGVRGPVLGRADKRAIWIGRRSPKLRIFNPLQAWAYCPDGSALALATHPETSAGGARLQFVDSRSLKRIATTRLPWGDVRALAWGSGRLNVVLQDWDAGELRILGIDGTTFRVVSRRTIQRKVFAVDRIGQTLVLLTGPQRGIGTAGLVVVDPDGSLRSVALPETLAGMDMPYETDPTDLSKVRQDVPGLAVDPASGRAFVVPASGPVAEISLATLGVSYHSVAQPVSLLGRLHDWVEPKAAAKGVNGPTRTAQWLGNGVVAVTGGDETAALDKDRQLHASWSPAGLTLIDTNTWGTKVIDRGADSFTVAGGTMLVTGAKWDDSARSGMGFAAYSFDGSRKLSVLRGDAAFLMLAWRGKAYLGLDGRNSATVVDLGTGNVVGARNAPLAQLLIGDGSS
jgi:hypothetical protein